MFTLASANASWDRLVKTKPVPPARAGKDWKGVPHANLLTAVQHAISLDVLNRHYHLSGDGAELTALLVFKDEGGLSPCLGITTATNWRHALRFYAGVRDRSGTVVTFANRLGAKYTAGFEPLTEAGAVASWFEDRVADGWAVARDLKALRVPPELFNRILITAGRRGALPWKKLGIFDRWWRRTYPAGSGSGWGLFEGFGRAASSRAVVSQPGNALKFFNIVTGREKQ